MDNNLQVPYEWSAPMAQDFRNAKKTILLSALSLHWARLPTENQHGQWCAALADAARRGVDVVIVLPQPSKAHPATAQNATHAAQAFAHGIKARWVQSGRLLHCKSCVIDSEVLWIGSGNFTGAAMSHNHEAYVRAENITFATRHAQHLLQISEAGVR